MDIRNIKVLANAMLFTLRVLSRIEVINNYKYNIQAYLSNRQFKFIIIKEV